jgi:hypothetical protein
MQITPAPAPIVFIVMELIPVPPAHALPTLETLVQVPVLPATNPQTPAITTLLHVAMGFTVTGQILVLLELAQITLAILVLLRVLPVMKVGILVTITQPPVTTRYSAMG